VPDHTIEGMTLFDFSQSENLLTRNNHGAAGDYATFAEASTAVFSQVVEGVPRSYFLFMGVYSMVRKHLVLAVLSALRQHKVQSALNLRQAIEGTVVMLFLIAKPAPFEMKDGDDSIPEKLNREARKWIAAEYPDRSEKLKSFKDDINRTDSHTNIVNSYATFDYEHIERGFSENRFFDRDDREILFMSLWNVGHITTHIVSAFAQVIVDHGRAFEINPQIDAQIDFLSSENDRLLALIRAMPRWEGLIEE
jgi:hypothetical protein